MTSGTFVETWERFLSRYVWSLYGHLTFRGIPTHRRAEDLFRKWIHKLNRKLYGQGYWKTHSGITWVRGEELQARGAEHFHVLIGHGQVAAPFERRLTAEFAQQAWSKMAGDGRVEYYQPHLSGIAYLVKKYNPDNGRIILSETLRAASL